MGSNISRNVSNKEKEKEKEKEETEETEKLRNRLGEQQSYWGMTVCFSLKEGEHKLNNEQRTFF